MALACPACGVPFHPPNGRAFLPGSCANCGGAVWSQRQFAGLELRALVGRGEMSVTFRAYDPERGCEVALKIIRPPAAALAPDIAAFVAAARRLRTLTHPHLVRVFAAGVEEGLPYLVMEYLPRGSLATRLAREGAMEEREVLALGCQAAEALDRAQAAGLPHRDLPPRRIRFAEDGTIRLTGFAESIFLDCASMDVGIVRGRLCYVSPERLCGLLEDARSEIYTLGAALHVALTGTAPHGGELHGEVLRDLLDTETVRVEDARPGLAPATCAVVNRMLQVDFAGRPQSWAEAAAALGEAQATVAGGGAGRGAVTLVLILLLALTVGVSAWTSTPEYASAQMLAETPAIY